VGSPLFGHKPSNFAQTRLDQARRLCGARQRVPDQKARKHISAGDTKTSNEEIAMSKGNDKKTKAGKSKPKAPVSSYKQAQGKAPATAIPFAKRIGVK
jgi:hypothetical protein